MQRVYYARWYLPACNHTARHPFTHSFFTVSLHLRTFPGRWTSLVNTGGGKEEIKDLWHFDNHFKAFIPFCPLTRLILGL